MRDGAFFTGRFNYCRRCSTRRAERCCAVPSPCCRPRTDCRRDGCPYRIYTTWAEISDWFPNPSAAEHTRCRRKRPTCRDPEARRKVGLNFSWLFHLPDALGTLSDRSRAAGHGRRQGRLFLRLLRTTAATAGQSQGPEGRRGYDDQREAFHVNSPKTLARA